MCLLPRRSLTRRLPPHRTERERVAGVNLQDNFGCTALMYASINGHTSTVQLMLDAKADASLQSIDGSTALMLAEYHNHSATAQVLRQHAKRSTATMLYGEVGETKLSEMKLSESGNLGDWRLYHPALGADTDTNPWTDAKMATAEYAAFMKGPDEYATFRATHPILSWPFLGPCCQDPANADPGGSKIPADGGFGSMPIFEFTEANPSTEADPRATPEPEEWLEPEECWRSGSRSGSKLTQSSLRPTTRSQEADCAFSREEVAHFQEPRLRATAADLSTSGKKREREKGRAAGALTATGLPLRVRDLRSSRESRDPTHVICASGLPVFCVTLLSGMNLVCAYPDSRWCKTGVLFHVPRGDTVPTLAFWLLHSGRMGNDIALVRTAHTHVRASSNAKVIKE